MARIVNLKLKERDVRLKDIPKYYESLCEKKISVGFHKDVGIRILTKAINTEFGGIIYFKPHKHYVLAPPRPIVRMYLYPRMKQEIAKAFLNSIDEEMNKGIRPIKTSAKNSLKKVGERCVDLQQEQIFLRDYDVSTNDTPFDPNFNGEEIVEYKGFDHPWIGKTGKTFNAINYKIQVRD